MNMKKISGKTMFFNAFLRVVLLPAILILNVGYGFSQNGKPSAPAAECLDATFVSKKNVCFGGAPNTGSVTFQPMVITGGGNCCPLPIDVVKCRLLDSGNASGGILLEFPVGEIGSPKTYSNIQPGTYDLRLRGYNNGSTSPCTENLISNFVTITTAADITITVANITKETCTGSHNGSFQVKAEGGTPPYTINVNGVDISAPENSFVQFSGFAAGTYPINVTDANFCTANDQVIIEVLNTASFDVAIDSTKNPDCFGGNNGYISVHVANGTAGETYTYSWPGNISGATRSNLVAGTYTVSVTAASMPGCDVSKMITLAAPPEIIAEAVPHKVSCNGKKDGYITLSVSGGASGYSYSWSLASIGNENNPTGLGGGTYSVTISDSKSCTKVVSGIIVTEPDPITYSVEVEQNPVESGQNAVLNLSGSGISYYKWSIESPMINASVPAPLNSQINGSSGSITIKLSSLDTLAPGYVTFLIQPAKDQNCIGDTTQILVLIKPKTADGFFIPEIYTPNGDGVNDDWNILIPENATGFVSIYNRSGGKVYEGDVRERWNGFGCPDGPYFYVLKYKADADAQEKYIKGAVTILRTER